MHLRLSSSTRFHSGRGVFTRGHNFWLKRNFRHQFARSGASIYPNKQWRAGMRENGERKRAVEDNPHGFWHRFGRATRWHSKDGICRAFRPVGVELEHGVLNGSAHHSIRFGYVPEIGSWRKCFLDSQRAKHAPKVAIVGTPLATPGTRTTAAKNATGRIPSKASMPISSQAPCRKSERLKHLLEKRI